MAIGDVNSTERGSGARFNGGKVRLDYVPAEVLYTFYVNKDETEPAFESDAEAAVYILGELSGFESHYDGDEGALRALSRALQAATCLYQMGTERFRATGDCFDFGAGKYAPWNWAKGMAWSVPLACIKRHCVKILEGEVCDDESGLPHFGHIGCNLVMLLHYWSNYKEGDDRPPRECFVRPGDEDGEFNVLDVPELINPETGDGECNDPNCLCHRRRETDHELRPIPGPRSIDTLPRC